MKLFGIAAAAAALGLALALVGVGRPASARGNSAATVAREITVSGNGSVRAVPDRAQFSFGVTTQGASATQALNANATLARRVIAAVEAAGVAAADVQTETVSLSPRLDDGGAIVGYTATNSVSATIRDLRKAGTLVDAAAGAGANDISGPALTRSDQTALYRAALRAAVADATAKADAIARAAGLRLGAVRSMVEGASSIPLPMARASAPAGEPSPVEPGTETIDASVTAEFAAG